TGCHRSSGGTPERADRRFRGPAAARILDLLAQLRDPAFDARGGYRANAGTVLLVDDLAANLAVLERLLVADGYTVFTASNGRDGVDMVRQVRPDIVLMDIRMPVLDGFSACRT